MSSARISRFIEITLPKLFPDAKADDVTSLVGTLVAAGYPARQLAVDLRRVGQEQLMLTDASIVLADEIQADIEHLQRELKLIENLLSLIASESAWISTKLTDPKGEQAVLERGASDRRQLLVKRAGDYSREGSTGKALWNAYTRDDRLVPVIRYLFILSVIEAISGRTDMFDWTANLLTSLGLRPLEKARGKPGKAKRRQSPLPDNKQRRGARGYSAKALRVFHARWLPRRSELQDRAREICEAAGI